MLTNTRLTTYIAFIVALAIWMGAGIHDSMGGHPAWYANPVTYIRAPVVPEGSVNPWPFTTALVALCTLGALAAFARYRGPGRREVLAVLAGVAVILVATGVYFVPTLAKFSNHTALSDEQIIAMSHTWMLCNIIRLVLVVALFTYSLVSLVRLSRSTR